MPNKQFTPSGCKLDEGNIRSLGFKHHSRVQDRILGSTQTEPSSQTPSFLPERDSTNEDRDSQTPRETSNLCGDITMQPKLSFQNIPGPKKDGSQRSVIKLRQLNQFVIWEHFKMENIHLVENLIQEGDWMIKMMPISLFQSTKSIVTGYPSSGRNKCMSFNAFPLAYPQPHECSPK